MQNRASVKLGLLGLGLVAMVSSTASAQESRDQSVNVRGFGSVYGSKFLHSDKLISYDNDGNNFSLQNDTRFGVGLSYRFNEKWEAYGQLLARRRTGEPNPLLDLLVLNYRPNDHFTFSVGRTISPVFLFSEQVEIGVTYPWVEPPMNIYPVNPIKTQDGVRSTYRGKLGRYRFQSDLYFGNGESQFYTNPGVSPNLYTARSTEGYGLNAEIETPVGEKFGARFRAGFLSTQVRLENVAEVNPTTTAAGVATTRLYSSFEMGRVKFISSGLVLRYGDTEFISEYALRLSETAILPRTAAIYGTLLHHFGAWTPYVTHFRFLDNEGTFRPHPNATATAAGVKHEKVISTTLGLSYQIDPSVLIKGEAHRIEEKFDNAYWDIKDYYLVLGADFVLF